MNFSTIPAVFDYLLALPATRPDLFTANPQVVIADGRWDQKVVPDKIVTIGFHATVVPNAVVTSGTHTPRNIALPLRVDEIYSVPCSIRVRDGDPNAQKKVRDEAFAMLNVYDGALRTDPTLGGIIPQYAYVSNFQLLEDDPDLEDGVVALLTFEVVVQNLLTT